MCARSKKSRADDPARPFEADTLDAAKKLVERYQIILVQDEDVWIGRGLELPNVFGDGESPDRCIAETRQAMTAAVATMLEMGQRPPAPAGDKRVEQVNVRLTAEEKLSIERTAKANGFRGIGDFMRTRALGASS